MKTKHILWAFIVIVALQSCSRAMSPYEAANYPKGKKCRNIR
jgi:hypothetical protein